MIDRRHLRYFLAVIDAGNFSRAAAQMNVAQPTLSVAIAQLEQLLGTQLFNRSNQRTHLTDAGNGLLVYARRIEREFNLAQQGVTGLRSETTARIGILTTISSITVAAAAAAARALKPSSRCELIEGNERDLAQHLQRGRIDLAVTLVNRGNDRFLEEPLFEEGYTLAMHESHELAEQSVIAAEALADNVMIVRRHCEVLAETSRHFTERGVRPFFALRSKNDDAVLKMVAAGLGITVVPASLTEAGIVHPLLSGFGLRRTVGIAYGRQSEEMYRNAPPLVRALRKNLQTVGPRQEH